MSGANGKGLVVALMLVVLTMFGGVNLINQDFEDFSVSIDIEGISIQGVGKYGVSASATVKNNADYDAVLYSADITVYDSISKNHIIIEYSITDTTVLSSGETLDTGIKHGTIILINDDIPDSVFVVATLDYMLDDVVYHKTYEFEYEIDLMSYLP